jgi:hypothetical protein
MRQGEALRRLKIAKDILPAADILRFFNVLAEAHKENKATEQVIEKITAAKEVALTQITEKHALYREAFNRIFEERRDVIARLFQIIDQGIAGNDRDLILRGLKGLGDLVASSPFANLKELAAALEAGTQIEF